MKLVVAALSVAALLLAPAVAYCPNGCNAQGTCGANDKCSCYLRADDTFGNAIEPMFTGADCSMRTCPRGNAFVDIPTADNVAHAPSECSSRGNCDYTTGLCQCYPGYDGKACERTACVNQCSHHGICLTLATIISYGPPSVTTYGAWDANKQLGCICDLGWRGPDCSIKECPSSADVLLGLGAAAGRDCGGRGKCDVQTGQCTCFPGYYGTTCSYQSTVH
ncbi:Aste57867_10165 [Aphanomyces stellatus]|uniref:Aste57867_10165 protein n=1 Tax=Aphanomyces stellatus TaxID=120398 RepID=A0A485KQB7_9STRA|nr:hypothetical protein As57867_010126 [Aphanomyces stellatus]VFT87041.1 Aste57867_10165 [Aphanomyces stellatus]